MDPDITLWILEFLARQPISQLLLNKILTNTHIPISAATNNPRFKKTLVLRSIQDEIANASASSETILESLEIIEELDRNMQIKILDSMKLAYSAVAVACTVKHLWVVGSPRKRDRGDFFEAVKRIWRDRVEKLELLKKSELVTDELREVKEEIEAALWDSNACKRLMGRDTRNEALRLVKEYLREALSVMGPSFLELAARVDREMKEKEKNGDKAGNEPTTGSESVVEDGHARKEAQKNDMLQTHNSPKGSAGIMDSEDVDMNIPPCKYNPLPSPEVTKVKEALKTSSMELKALVKDPLPDALHLSEALMAEMERKELNNEISVEKKNEKGVDLPDPSINAVVSREAGKILNPVPAVETPSSSVNQSIESIQSMKTNAGVLIPSHQTTGPKHSLMERNSTACTYEWNDSIDGLPEETTNHTNRFHLDSPRKKVVSPLKLYQVPKFARRRQMKRWSVEEEDALREGVQMFGRGSWKVILNSYQDVFDDRTEVDLKDKWRNMTK